MKALRGQGGPATEGHVGPATEEPTKTERTVLDVLSGSRKTTSSVWGGGVV